jgi:hypothetical protein
MQGHRGWCAGCGTGARMPNGNMLHLFGDTFPAETKQEYHGAIREENSYEGHGTSPIVSLAVANPAALTLC